jgi:hypothetical protein
MMKAIPRNAKGLRGQSDCTNQNKDSADIFTDLREAIKRKLMNASSVRVIDYPEHERGFVLAVIAGLRDELPVRCGWQTVRESHASETRTRARTYSIPSEFLREMTP